MSEQVDGFVMVVPGEEPVILEERERPQGPKITVVKSTPLPRLRLVSLNGRTVDPPPDTLIELEVHAVDVAVSTDSKDFTMRMLIWATNKDEVERAVQATVDTLAKRKLKKKAT